MRLQFPLCLGLGLTLAGGILTLTSGCASPAATKAMTPTEFQTATHHPGSVLVHVEGGQETSPDPFVPSISQVDSGSFQQSLLATINESRLFTSAVSDGKADYRLDVSIVKLARKSSLSRWEVMDVRWKLVRSRDAQTLLDELVESTAKAGLGEGFNRGRTTREKVARENIRLGLTKVASLELR